MAYIKNELEERTYVDEKCVLCNVKEWECTYKDQDTEQRHILQLCDMHFREFNGHCPTHESILRSDSAPTTVMEKRFKLKR